MNFFFCYTYKIKKNEKDINKKIIKINYDIYTVFFQKKIIDFIVKLIYFKKNKFLVWIKQIFYNIKKIKKIKQNNK